MKKHLQVVGAVIVQDGCVLAAKRGESRYLYVAHKFEFAGGKIEPGETPEQALARELSEELLTEARVLRPYAEVTHEYPDFIITLHTYLCELLTPFSRTEHEQLSWLPLEELCEEEWAPADAPIVRKLRQEWAGGVPTAASET